MGIKYVWFIFLYLDGTFLLPFLVAALFSLALVPPLWEVCTDPPSFMNKQAIVDVKRYKFGEI